LLIIARVMNYIYLLNYIYFKKLCVKPKRSCELVVLCGRNKLQRIVTIDYVTSVHRMYTNQAVKKIVDFVLDEVGWYWFNVQLASCCKQQ